MEDFDIEYEPCDLHDELVEHEMNELARDNELDEPDTGCSCEACELGFPCEGEDELYAQHADIEAEQEIAIDPDYDDGIDAEEEEDL